MQPMIKISTRTFKKMGYYIRFSAEIVPKNHPPNEISWLGTVQKQGRYYYINDVFLFGQRATVGSFQFLPGSIAEFATDLLRKGDKNIVNSLFFWGHTHLRGTLPSVLDDEQMKIFSYNDFMIRGIADRCGRIEFSIFEYKKGRIFHKVPWEIWDQGDEKLKSKIRKEIQGKLKNMRGVNNERNGFLAPA